jgi:nucleoside-diphosphate-sugar epimerase
MTTVVVTGARGYIGSALAPLLQEQGRDVRHVSRTPREGTWIAADLRAIDDWARLLEGADAVVHLSARTDLRAAEADPAGDAIINIDPVRRLIDAARLAGTRPRVVYASAVTIVGPEHENPVDECTPDRPCSVYDRHKLACETLLREATAEGVLNACSLRLANVYGPGHSINANRGILNMMMRRALRGEPLTLYGAGNYIRDFIHLDDVVAAFAAALEANVCDGRHYVIASGQGHSLAEAYRMIAAAAASATGLAVQINSLPEPAGLHAIERRNFVGDPALFSGLTGWRPTITLAEGIRRFFVAHATNGVSSG